MTESEKLRRALVADLVDELDLSDRVRDAFRAVPRERFLPRHAAEHGLEAVYRDEAIVTRTDAGGTATSSSSQPTMMALMLEALRLEPGLRVLEIGAGTGYNAALLAHVLGPEGHVVTVDVDPETAADAREALRGSAVEVLVGDGREGWPAGAPYDRIVVTASTPAVYPAWWKQLAPDGLLQAPLHLGDGLQPVVTFRRAATELRSVEVRVGAFMTLRSPAGETLAALPPAARAGGIRISGGALAAATLEDRQRLALLVAGAPRVRRPLRDTPFFALALFLSLSLPEERFLAVWPPFGVGVATPDGGAALVVAPDRRRKRVTELRAYGSAEAEDVLLAAVAAWEERGRPSEAALEILVDFADEDAPRLSHRFV